MLSICANILLNWFFSLSLFKFFLILKLLAWILFLSSRLYKHYTHTHTHTHTRVFHKDHCVDTTSTLSPQISAFSEPIFARIRPSLFLARLLNLSPRPYLGEKEVQWDVRDAWRLPPVRCSSDNLRPSSLIKYLGKTS